MIYPIVIYGDEVLRRKCEPIAPDYPDVKKLAEDMFLTLEEAEGVGLAAPQIGKDIRLFIVDCTPGAGGGPVVRRLQARFRQSRDLRIFRGEEDL